MKATKMIAVMFWWLSSIAALPQTTSVEPFVGLASESWESFPTFDTAGYLPNPTLILGGIASIANPWMTVYRPPGFGLGGADALVHDGAQAMGLDNEGPSPQTVAISFLQPVTDFGAYWGAGIQTPQVEVSLFGTDGGLLGTHSFLYASAGALEWYGWHSEAPIGSLSYRGDLVVIDALQVVPVPEPSALTLALFAGVGIALYRSLRTRKRNVDNAERSGGLVLLRQGYGGQAAFPPACRSLGAGRG